MDGITTILLDVDGTVLDSSEFIYQAAEYAFAQGGHSSISREKISEGMGLSFDEFFYAMLGRRDIDTAPLQADFRIFQFEHFDLASAFPGAVDTLSALKERKYALAAITNRWRATLMPTMDSSGLTPLFDVIVAPDDTPEVKPSPVHLETALRALGTEVSEAVMVGDTDIDMQAGRAAGVKTVRALYGHHFNSETETKADFYIKDVKELLDLFP